MRKAVPGTYETASNTLMKKYNYNLLFKIS